MRQCDCERPNPPPLRLDQPGILLLALYTALALLPDEPHVQPNLDDGTRLAQSMRCSAREGGGTKSAPITRVHDAATLHDAAARAEHG